MLDGAAVRHAFQEMDRRTCQLVSSDKSPIPLRVSIF